MNEAGQPRQATAASGAAPHPASEEAEDKASRRGPNLVLLYSLLAAALAAAIGIAMLIVFPFYRRR
jgi:uncharacterized protein HemX